MLNGLRHGEAASYGQQRPPQRTDRPSALIDDCWHGAPDCRDLSTVVVTMETGSWVARGHAR